ncbi:enoyl-CoA hydratase-related protein [Pseudonocardia abyssalis]|uniref:Enoyl-CoA hydratase/isomerase family protein n=1 Tax=Pseudonocardia abyssalis TaxID=2792008 RepID=A0ABS6UR12_9PSEU|nr:enoyl-CoA hydratase-related protein [Pseudonocardia abyssalis]MBW0119602.1 enoyl-CoA hydratase/isomerase family protein [Pseudonocardia abyssalis]MBW0134667.1 enoyl-CoA hydratase/isomerase family protein [Pseudonocardia abyssalis]
MTGAVRPVSTEVRGHVLVVTVDRPARRNAIDRATADGLSAALDRLDDDPDLWCGVLTGAGGYFCAGSDLTANGDYVTGRGGEYGVVRRERRTPLIAAVEGFALGGGMEIALACDLVVAASDSRFGLPEVGIGLIPTCGALFRGPRALPVNIARELVLTGDPMSAARAHDLGFVNLLTDPGGALDGALGLAQRICRNAPLAVAACVRAIDDALGGDGAGWTATEAAKDVVLPSADAAEGVAAFLGKRPPTWTAR